MQGRKPDPTQLKLIKGIVNKKRINFDEPKPRPAIDIKPPVWMHKDGKKEWKRIAKQLCRLGIVTEIDYAIIVGYCNAWGKFVEAERKLRESGPLFKTATGNITTSPYSWVSNKAQEQILKYAPDLGIGASARSRIKSIKGSEDDGEDLLT